MTIHNGIILVGSRNHFQFPRLAAHKPYPSAAEPLRAGVVELLLKLFKAAKRFFDLVADTSGWRPSALRFHDLPEHGVVHVTTAIVANRTANVFRHRVDIPQ